MKAFLPFYDEFLSGVVVIKACNSPLFVLKCFQKEVLKLEDSVVQYFYTLPKDSSFSSPADIHISWAGHRKCTASHNIGPRVLDTYKLVVVLSGKGYLEQDSHPAIPLSAGDMFFLFPLHLHHYWADPEDPWEIMWVAFNSSLCPRFLSSIHISHDHYVLNGILNDSLQRAMYQVINALGDESDQYRFCAIGALYTLFYKIDLALRNQEAALPESEESIATKITAFIDQNFYLPIDMDTLCQHVSYSRSYISRIFKAEMGMTVSEYVQKTRIRNAQSLLRDTNISIQEVSYSVGIDDPLYFSKTFRKLVGISPRDYRNQAKARS